MGAVTAGAFNFVGHSEFATHLYNRIGNAATRIVKTAAHGLVGGLSSAVQGGKFVSGFLSSGVTQAFAPQISRLNSGTMGISPTRIAAAATLGGASSVLGGGKFANGARTMAFLHLFKEAPGFYKRTVGYDLDASPGGAAVGKDPISGPPVQGANNIGTQDININPNSVWGEGGKVSRFANQIPTVNAIAGMHDVFQVSMGGSIWRDVLNVPGMAVAAGVTYAGFVGQMLNSAPDYVFIPIQINDDDRKPKYMWVPAGGY